MRRTLIAVLLIGLLLPGGLVRGQDPGLDTRVFTARYKSVDDVLLLIRPLLGSEASVTLQPRLRTLTVTDEPARLEKIAAVLNAFDVPPRRVSLAVSLILGSKGVDVSEPLERPRRPQPLPGFDATLKALEHTVWTDYRLLGSASFATAEGEEAEVSLGRDYRIRLRVDRVNGTEGITRFDRFALERRTENAGKTAYHPVWNQMTLNLQDNRLYVFGATRMEDSQRAIFLSVTAGIEAP